MSRLGRISWAVGAPARLTIVGAIRLYRLTLSGWLGSQCRFYPTCSRYTEEAVRTHGAIRGSLMGLWRIARCGPFTDGGVDHVPPPRQRHGRYDSVIQERSAA